MKKILFAMFGAAVVFAGCKEHDIPIDFTVRAASDTTYILSSVPATDAHQVLVEEFTGQSCPNCPSAHTDLDNISASPAGSGRVNVISMYTYGSPQSKPPTGNVYDFEDSTATNILTGIYSSVAGLPAAGIDRVSESGNIVQIGNASWDGYITTQLSAADPLNISVTSSYAASGVATITAKVTYTQSIATPQNLSIVVVEDSITDLQEFPGIVQSYVFMDVFRGMVTSPPTGDVLQVAGSDAKEAGRVFQKVYNYTLPAKIINPLHCRVIAFVNSSGGSDKHVLQSAQCKLVQ